MSSVFYGITTRLYHYDRTIGKRVLTGPGFRIPVDIAVGPEGRIYVVNRPFEFWPDNMRITIVTIDEEFIGQFSEFGEGDGQLNQPSGIKFDRENNLFLVDSSNNRVQVFTKDGKLLARWDEAGNGEGQFNRPTGVAVDKEGDIYVADWWNDRVQVLTPDGRHITTFTGDADLSK